MNSAAGLTLALPKGRLLTEISRLLVAVGLPGLAEEEARLVVEVSPGLRYLVTRPSDVVTYVKEGAADLGVTGKDVLMENRGGYYELLDLGVGCCRLSVAGRPLEGEDWQGFLMRKGNRLRVATKHPASTAGYFVDQGLKPVILTLGGALELAPQVGLADAIVDLVETGRTLRANGLVELAEITPVTARLIANPAAFRFKTAAVEGLVASLRRVMNGTDGSGGSGGSDGQP